MSTIKATRSGQMMANIWERFLDRYAKAYPHSKAPSKRYMSTLLCLEPQTLARWCNDKSHVPDKPNWRIPIKRIQEACTALLATQEELDELMMCRVQEVMDDAEKPDIHALLYWMAPLIQSLASRPEVDASERMILDVHRKARDTVPGSEHATMTKEGCERLIPAFTDVWKEAVNDHLQELKAEADAEAKAQLDEPERDIKLARSKAKIIAGIKDRAQADGTKGMKSTTQDALMALRNAMRAFR